MKFFNCASALLVLFATSGSAQTAYDGPAAVRLSTSTVTVIPWEALQRRGALIAEPFQTSPAVIGTYFECEIVEVGGEFGDDPVGFERCNPVIVWCPKPDEACVTVN